MIEGGPTIHAALIEADLADRLVAYVAPTWLGADAIPCSRPPPGTPPSRAARWRMLSVRAVGGDARVELEPVR